MRLLFVADGRSPIALNWIRYFIKTRHEVHLASSYLCEAEPGLASLHIIPLALSKFQGASKPGSRGDGGRQNLLRRAVSVKVRTAVRQWLGPLTLPAAARNLREVVEQVQPELVHAMRIPYEGMLASLVLKPGDRRCGEPPLLISVWGNDFTLHARSTPWMAALTRKALHAAGALHTDCQRDQRLARLWGFNPQKPAIVLPGGGGVMTDVFFPGKQGDKAGNRINIINPRGFRAYVRNDTFFRAIPLVLAKQPQAHFLCPTMAGETQAEKWVEDLGISSAVELLPYQSHQQIAELFRQAEVVISITTHDGTPNTLLEALACGCFPIAGNIEALREWITPGVNGLLVNPGDPSALAGAILAVLAQPELRTQAGQKNSLLVEERAEYGRVMSKAEEFYRLIVSYRPSSPM